MSKTNCWISMFAVSKMKPCRTWHATRLLGKEKCPKINNYLSGFAQIPALNPQLDEKFAPPRPFGQRLWLHHRWWWRTCLLLFNAGWFITTKVDAKVPKPNMGNFSWNWHPENGVSIFFLWSLYIHIGSSILTDGTHEIFMWVFSGTMMGKMYPILFTSK